MKMLHKTMYTFSMKTLSCIDKAHTGKRRRSPFLKKLHSGYPNDPESMLFLQPRC